MKLSFKGKKTSEVRKQSIFWQRLVAHALRELEAGNQVEGVFVCGGLTHRRLVVDISEHKNAKAALGRTPSPQGMRDLGNGPVYKFHLGHAVDNLVSQLEAAA